MCDDRTRTPFFSLNEAFCQLTSPPVALSIDGADIEGLPDRRIDLRTLRKLLLKRTTPFPARDAAVAALLRRAQTGAQVDFIGLAGVLLPGLARKAVPLLSKRPDLLDDIEIEILTSLVTIIPTLDPAQDRLAARLIDRATRAGHDLLKQDRLHHHAELTAELSEALVEPPTPPPHPDFLLDQAVADGVITRAEAELIGQTRINGTSIHELTASTRHSYKGIQKRRRRAERRLVPWLLTRRLSTDSP